MTAVTGLRQCDLNDLW